MYQARMMFDTRLTSGESQNRPGGSALRAFGWQELTARINAARDLRAVLQRDCGLMTASFGDAAAGYFSDAGQGKPDVNHSALGGRKASDGTEKIAESKAATGDREI